MTDKPELTRAMTPSQSGELAEQVREACAKVCAERKEHDSKIASDNASKGNYHTEHTYRVMANTSESLEVAICALGLSPFAVPQVPEFARPGVSTDAPATPAGTAPDLLAVGNECQGEYYTSALFRCRCGATDPADCKAESFRENETISCVIRAGCNQEQACNKAGYCVFGAHNTAAPSPVGLPEEPFSRGAVEMEAYLSMFSGSVDMAFAGYVRKLRAYSTAAEQRVGEAHLKFTAEFMRAERSHERNKQLQSDLETKRVECDMLYESAGLMKRDLDAARACIRDADALTRKFIDKVESGGAFSKTTYAECVKFQADHKAALAHREPAGGEGK